MSHNVRFALTIVFGWLAIACTAGHGASERGNDPDMGDGDGDVIFGGDGDAMGDGDVGSGGGSGGSVPVGDGGAIGMGGEQSTGGAAATGGAATGGTGGEIVECDVPTTLILPESASWSFPMFEYTCEGGPCAGELYYLFGEPTLEPPLSPNSPPQYTMTMVYATDMITVDVTDEYGESPCTYQHLWGTEENKRTFTIDLLPVEGGFIVDFEWTQMHSQIPRETYRDSTCYAGGPISGFEIGLNEQAADGLLGAFVPCN